MYRSYRGGHGNFGCLIPTLVVLCIVAALILLFLQQNLAFTADGMMLKIPFSDREIPIGVSKKEKSTPIVIEKETPDQTAKPEPEPEQKQEPVTTPVRDEYETRIEKSVFVPEETLLDSNKFDALLDSISGSDINTLILEVKADSGKLALKSDSELAVTAGAGSVDNTNLKDALTKLTKKGIHAVAQISCFRDNLAARKSRSFAARTKKKIIWLDLNNITWLNPYTEEARGYITDLVSEVYELGFREVFLTNISFPYRGKTSILYYSDEAAGTTKRNTISKFISEISSLAKTKEGLHVSARYDLFATETSPEPGGQVLADLTNSFYRIYAQADPLKNMQIFDDVKKVIGDTDFNSRFVPIISFSGGVSAKTTQDLINSAKSRGNGFELFKTSGIYPESLFAKQTMNESTDTTDAASDFSDSSGSTDTAE